MTAAILLVLPLRKAGTSPVESLAA
jgi:hypothetical protein